MTIIHSINEIIKPSIKYTTYNGLNPKWFQIDKESEGYCIYGYVCGSIPTSVCKGDMVQFWKTWNGVIKAIRRFTQEGSWGFQNYFPNERRKNDNL